MKLIKPGKKEPQKFIGTCHSCGAQYEADRSELNVEFIICRGSGSGEKAYKDCPFCKSKVPFALTFRPVVDNDTEEREIDLYEGNRG